MTIFMRQGLRHERLKQALQEFWFRRLPPEIKLITETTFRLDKDTFAEPDFLFFRAADGLADLSPATALLAVEVADSSLDHDLKRKTQLYAVHGMREVWVIEAESLTTHVRRSPDAVRGQHPAPSAPHPLAPNIIIIMFIMVR